MWDPRSHNSPSSAFPSVLILLTSYEHLDGPLPNPQAGFELGPVDMWVYALTTAPPGKYWCLKEVTKILGNHRSISLTSVTGKLLDSIAEDKIVSHLESHPPDKDPQDVFRRKRFCFSCLLLFFNNLSSQNNQTDHWTLSIAIFKRHSISSPKVTIKKASDYSLRVK